MIILKIVNTGNIDSFLKAFFDDFTSNFLDSYYVDAISSVDAKTDVELRALTYLTKYINTLQSINTLFKSGDVVSARILMRSLFELTVLVKKLESDKEKFITFSLAYEKFKIIQANKIHIEQINRDEDFQLFHTVEELNKNILKLKNDIIELGFLATNNKANGKPHVEKYFEIKQMCIDVGMVDLYNTAYKNLCLDTHTSSGHYYKYILSDAAGNPVLNMHPYLHELDLMIFTTCGFMMDFFDLYEKLLGINSTHIASIQYQKLLTIAFKIKDKLLKQGYLKKNGIIV